MHPTNILSKIFLLVIILQLPVSVFASSNDKYINKFREVFERVDKSYVETPDKQKMLEAALEGMLSGLDPHSSYLNEEEYSDLKEHTKGEFGGIGVEVIYENGVIKIISPIEDLAADRAGIKAGDLIVSVDDETVSNLGFIKAVKKMRGKPGTKVHLSIVREGELKTLEFDIIREIVKIRPVKGHMDNKVAYLRIATFNDNTTDELKMKLNEILSKSNNELEGIILDLRNNPGGLLNQAISVSDYFLKSGEIVSTKGRTRSSIESFAASSFSPKAPNVPMVVLINSGSASASEIVAGALQDHKRAVIMGTKSFGKGSVQLIMPLDKDAMKLTISQYYTPSGRSIQADGIEPDIIVEPASVEKIEGLEGKRSEASLKNHLKNETRNIEKKSNSYKSVNDSELYKKDYQYARAFDLIKGMSLLNSAENRKAYYGK